MNNTTFHKNFIIYLSNARQQTYKLFNNVFKKFSKAKKVLSHQKEKKVNEVNLLLNNLEVCGI